MDGSCPNEILKVFKEIRSVENPLTNSNVSLRKDITLPLQDLLDCTFEEENCTVKLSEALEDETGVLYFRFFTKRFFNSLVVNLRELKVLEIEDALTEVKLGLLAADERKHRFHLAPAELSAAEKQPARPSNVAKFNEIDTLVAKPRKRRVKAWEGLVKKKNRMGKIK
eukprot:GHVP01049672.1.p1 GENE.GHVP01049672.1~~GHVP01049672.1.p1  ORF type:complete len:168 (+),score=34.20 GHVP01049672.1:231-734(+)